MRSPSIAGFAAFLSFSAPLSPTEITLRLLDEGGQLIPASQFVVDPGGTNVAQGGVVDLAPGSCTIRLFPGIQGFVQGSDLWRDESLNGLAYGLRLNVQLTRDLDRDGFARPADTDDTDPSIYPGAPDWPGDDVDQDGDGVRACDPGAAWRHPGEFLAAVALEAEALLRAGRIAPERRDAIVLGAARRALAKSGR